MRQTSGTIRSLCSVGPARSTSHPKGYCPLTWIEGTITMAAPPIITAAAGSSAGCRGALSQSQPTSAVPTTVNIVTNMTVQREGEGAGGRRVKGLMGAGAAGPQWVCQPWGEWDSLGQQSGCRATQGSCGVRNALIPSQKDSSQLTEGGVHQQGGGVEQHDDGQVAGGAGQDHHPARGQAGAEDIWHWGAACK